MSLIDSVPSQVCNKSPTPPERYGGELGIEIAESIFCNDSQLIASCLLQNADTTLAIGGNVESPLNRPQAVLAQSLAHMMVNRGFVSEPRANEFVVYDLVIRSLRSLAARAR